MAITFGGLIEYTDYNTIRNKINDILGVGSSDYGYGQTVTSQTVSQNAIIGHLEWNNLRADMAKIKTHQTGITVGTTRGSTDGNNLVDISSSDTITYQDIHQYQLFADTIDTNRFSIASSQKSTDTTTFTQSTDWNGTLQFATSATASSATNMRYFFNSGGYIEWTGNITDGATGTKQHDWATIVNTKVIKIDHANVYVNSSVVSANGWYNLTTGVDHVLTYDSTAFPGNQLKITITKDSDTLLSVTYEMIDGNSNNLDTNVTGSTVLSMTQTYSSGVVTAEKLSLGGLQGGGSPVAQASVTPTVTTVQQGVPVTFNISTSYVPEGTTLYWSNIGTSTSSMFSDGVNNGSVVISGGSATIVRTLNIDIPNNVTIIIQLFNDSQLTIPASQPSAAVTVNLYGYVYAVTLASLGTVYNFNLFNAAMTDGWDAVSLPLLAYVTVDGVVGSASTTQPAFTDNGVYPEFSFFNLTVNPGCYIVGAGGNGGSAQSDGGGDGNPGSPGGVALDLSGSFPQHNSIPSKQIINNGTIGGGGGGGGGGYGAGWPLGSYGGTQGGGGGGGAGSLAGSGAAKFGANGTLITGGSGGTNGNITGGPGGWLGSPGSAGQGGTQSYNKGSSYAAGGAGGSAGTAVTYSASADWITGVSGLIGPRT